MEMILFMLILSVVDLAALLLFVAYEHKRESRIKDYLAEHHDIEERMRNIVLSPDLQKRCDEIDEYFKHLQESLFNLVTHPKE